MNVPQEDEIGGRRTGLDVHWTYVERGAGVMATETRRRSRRLELSTTPAERDLIDRAAALTETDLTEFVVANAVEAARRALADRERFELDGEAMAAWEAINARRARELPGLAALMRRPSPFAE